MNQMPPNHLSASPGKTGQFSASLVPRTKSDTKPAATTLDSIQQQLECIAAVNASRIDVMQKFVELACQSTNAIWCGHLATNDQRQLTFVVEHNGVANQNFALMKSSLLPTAEASVATMKPRVTTSGEMTVIATPILDMQRSENQSTECLCLALSLGGEPPASFLLVLQMVAAYVGRWYERGRMKQLNWQVDATAAIAELAAEISRVDHRHKPAMIATNRLASFLNAEVVAIAYVANEGSLRTRVESISGALEVDNGGELAKQISSVLEESLVRGAATTFPDPDGSDRIMKLAHQSMIEANPDCSLVSSPLVTKNGRTIGAWLCLLPADDTHQARAIQFVKTVSSYLAESLDVARRASAGSLTRMTQQMRSLVTGRFGMVAAAVTLAITLIMAIPIPHRLDCSCVIVPAKREFAVAPYNGILIESLVKPGDIVVKSQILARMDDRELRLELADLVAQQQTAIKERDVSRSSRDAAATKISEYKLRQLDAKLAMVNHRLSNLEIKAVSDGVVLQGDLDDARGAPVKTGDVLLELASLERLKIEVEILDSQVAYAAPGQQASIVLDGKPFETIHGLITSLHPESEARDQKNVFVGEILVANQDNQLRPGMKGRAKITEASRSIGWILFHRPCEKLYSLLR